MAGSQEKGDSLMLKFITHTGHPTNSEDDKRQVRQHVSRRFAAVSRHKAGRCTLQRPVQVLLEVPERLLASSRITNLATSPALHKRHVEIPEIPVIERFGSCSDPFVRYPIETTTQERMLVDESRSFIPSLTNTYQSHE